MCFSLFCIFRIKTVGGDGQECPEDLLFGENTEVEALSWLVPLGVSMPSLQCYELQMTEMQWVIGK